MQVIVQTCQILCSIGIKSFILFHIPFSAKPVRIWQIPFSILILSGHNLIGFKHIQYPLHILRHGGLQRHPVSGFGVDKGYCMGM